MKRVAVAIGLAAGLAVGLLAVASGTSRASAPRAPARLFVSAKEWSLVTSRQTPVVSCMSILMKPPMVPLSRACSAPVVMTPAPAFVAGTPVQLVSRKLG